jgi:RNA polymerase-binding transcription factor DksA
MGNRMKPHTKATTSQILGGNNHVIRIDPKWQEHYDSLIVLRAQVGKRKDGLNEIAREEQEAFGLHMADAGTDEFDRDFALSIMSSDQNALFEIDAALERIRQGSYGLCEISGEPIEPERLAAIPWTRYSAAAQRELEETGDAARTRLCERGAWNEPSSTEEGAEEAEAA